MHRCFIASLGLAVTATAALAASEGKFSKPTVDGITKALTEAGCKVGQIESGDGYYEVGGSECADGKYTINVDTNFKITDKKKME